MRVVLAMSSRADEPMGLELAERRLLDEARARANGLGMELRVAGGRAALRTARRLGGRWVASRPGRASRRLWRGADLVHLTGLTLPPPPDGMPFVASFYDLSPLHFDDEGTLPPWTEELAARARLCLCLSGFTASELERHLGVPRERLRVFSAAPGQDVSPPPEPLSRSELAELGLESPFVLRLGGYTRRKNLPLLAQAWPEAHRRTGASLVLAGPAQPWRARELGRLDASPGVRVLDYVPAEIAPRLLRSAACLVSTSTYEGFGLPALEAMALGTPVVAVRAPFSEEVCGDAALLVEPDAGAVADALARVLSEGDLRARLREAGSARAAGFSWERSADAVLSAYREALSR